MSDAGGTTTGGPAHPGDSDGDGRAGPEDLWAEVVGQGDAVAQLRAAVTNPVHAYLLVGPPGSGRRAAARAFAADLLVDGLPADEADRVRHLVGREQYASLAVFERTGPFITVDQAHDIRMRTSMTAPLGERQVFLLIDVHLLREAYGALLKTLEEPPPGTVLVLVAEELPAELVTVASRCVRIDFRPVPRAELVERLVAEGAERDRAELVATAAAGDLRRARLLVGDERLAARRERWFSAPARLDGTGAAAVEVADELLASVEEVVAPVAAVHAEELAELEAELEEYGIRAKGQVKVLEDQHKREQRRVRTGELLSGLRAVTDRYRDALAEGLAAEDFVAAGEAVQRWCEDLRFNPNERLALVSLLTSLPRLPR